MPPLKVLRNRWKQSQEALIEFVARVHSCLLAGEYDRDRPGSKYYYKKMLELAERDPELYRKIIYDIDDSRGISPLEKPTDAGDLQDILLDGLLIPGLVDWWNHRYKRCPEVDDIIKEYTSLKNLK